MKSHQKEKKKKIAALIVIDVSQTLPERRFTLSQ
jgi:hypothetical protein